MAAREETELEKRLKALGRSQSELGRRLGKTSSAIHRIVTGDRKNLTAREAGEIDAILDEWSGKPALRLSGRIPLLGYAAAGGEDRIAWSFDRPMEWVEAPPMADGGADVIAIRISGDSMEPRLFSGETIYVGLNVRPAKDGDSVIEFRDGTAVVKSYTGRKDGVIHARQYNPPVLLTYPEISVQGVHAVLWRR